MTIAMTEAEFLRGSEEMEGICLDCGEYRDMCEPDAREYPCEGCGENKVYGLEELLVMGKIEFTRIGGVTWQR